MGIPCFWISLHFLICAHLVHLIWPNPWVALLFSLSLLRHLFPPSLPLRLILGLIAWTNCTPGSYSSEMPTIFTLPQISHSNLISAFHSREQLCVFESAGRICDRRRRGGSIKNSTNHSRRTLDGTVASLCCLPRTQSLILQCCVITLHSDTWPESKYSYKRWQISTQSGRLPSQALLHWWLITH